MTIPSNILYAAFIIYGVFVFLGIVQIILDVINHADEFDSKED
jgi:hypothetical protein